MPSVDAPRLLSRLKRALVGPAPLEISIHHQSNIGEIGLTSGSFVNCDLDRTVTAYRIIERSAGNIFEGPLAGGGVLVTGKRDRIQQLAFLPMAEDPRVFMYLGVPHVYFQMLSLDPPGNSLHILRVAESGLMKFRIESDLEFDGKNWSPFEWADTLYFVHTMDPFTVMRTDSIGESDGQWHVRLVGKEPAPRWEWGAYAGSRNVSEYRGGAPGIPIEDDIWFFGHKSRENRYKDDHGLFLLTLSPETGAVVRVDLSKRRHKPLLIDAYGCSVSSVGRITVRCTIAEGFMHEPTNALGIADITYSQAELRDYTSKCGIRSKSQALPRKAT